MPKILVWGAGVVAPKLGKVNADVEDAAAVWVLKPNVLAVVPPKIVDPVCAG